jgi:hypothetical protein
MGPGVALKNAGKEHAQSHLNSMYSYFTHSHLGSHYAVRDIRLASNSPAILI